MKLPPYIQRGLMALVVFLLMVSVARLLVTMHQQDERISILESQVETLLADTARLQMSDSFYVPKHTSHGGVKRSGYRPKYASHDSQKSFLVSSDSTIADGRPASVEPVSDRPRKFTEPHLFDLNTIDSITLIRIPGIAARTASVILKQRQRYGGFYVADQLRDFLTWEAAQTYLDEWCSQWFTANADRIVRLPINKATVSQLVRHPYITYEQAVEIVRYRDRNKGFHQASELQMLSSMTADDISHLLPYLSFENS